MSVRVVIVGAGGFGRGVHGWLISSPRHRSEFRILDVVFIDDDLSVIPSGGRLIGTIRDYVPAPDDRVLCAVGSPTIRRRLVSVLRAAGAKFHTFIDDRATVSPGVRIDAGAVVCPGTVVSADARLGEHVHVNFNSSVGHDTILGGYSTLSPAVNIMGEVRVGDSVFFGGGATVLPRISVGDAATVGAGAVVIHDVEAGSTVVGNPARLLKHQTKPSLELASTSSIVQDR